MLRSLWNIFVVWPLRLTWRFILWLYDLFQKHVWPWMQNTVWPWYKGQSRRTQIIVGCVTGVLLISCCAFGAANSNANTNTDTTNQQASTGGSSTNASPSGTTSQPTATHVAATATANPHPTVAPVATQPVSHPPTATTPPAPKYPAINSNPWDYTFTNTGHLLYQPVGSFCSSGYFTCVSTFWKDTKGFVIQCNNGRYSHSGGVQGECSRDGGPGNPVYQP